MKDAPLKAETVDDDLDNKEKSFQLDETNRNYVYSQSKGKIKSK